jgi:hypothetical protein
LDGLISDNAGVFDTASVPVWLRKDKGLCHELTMQPDRAFTVLAVGADLESSGRRVAQAQELVGTVGDSLPPPKAIIAAR